MSTLRSRCANFLLNQDPMTRKGSPLDDLIAFVIAETGRKADAKLDQSLPLCLYFPTAADREEFIDAFLEAKPHLTARKLP